MRRQRASDARSLGGRARRGRAAASGDVRVEDALHKLGGKAAGEVTNHELGHARVGSDAEGDHPLAAAHLDHALGAESEHLRATVSSTHSCGWVGVWVVRGTKSIAEPCRVRVLRRVIPPTIYVSIYLSIYLSIYIHLAIAS